MYQNEEFILGNASLHTQLSTALAVMTQIVCNTSRAPTAQQLSDTLEVSVRYLRKLLRKLTGGGLLKPHDKNSDTWVCARQPHTISLADIYHSLVAAEEQKSVPFVAPPQADAVVSSAELLLMQATVSINQIVLQHLQQFDLGRLKVAESAMLYAASLRDRARYPDPVPTV